MMKGVLNMILHRMIPMLLDTVPEVTTTGKNPTDILSQVVEKTNNDIIILAIVIIVALILVGIPIIRIIHKRKQQEFENEIHEKKILIDLIKDDNESVINSLKATLDLHHTAITDVLHHIDTITTEQGDHIKEFKAQEDESIEQLNRLIKDIKETEEVNLKNDAILINKSNMLGAQSADILSKLEILQIANEQSRKDINTLMNTSTHLIELVEDLLAKAKRKTNTKPTTKKKTITPDKSSDKVSTSNVDDTHYDDEY